MLSAKSEGHAVGGTLLFNVLHYAVRPWPWILVALVSLVVFPLTPQIERDAAEVWLETHATAVRAYETDSASLATDVRHAGSAYLKLQQGCSTPERYARPTHTSGRVGFL
jgi:hypothetical protein